MFEIVGSSADWMPKRKLVHRLRDLRPIWFVKTSLNYMKGQPRLKVWRQMLPTYIRYVRLCLEK